MNVYVCMSMCVRVCVCVFAVPGFCKGTGKLEPSTQACLRSVTKADWLTSDCVGPLAEDEGAFSLTQEQEVSPSLCSSTHSCQTQCVIIGFELKC